MTGAHPQGSSARAVKNLVLGSGSPRRREILGALGATFVVRPADVDETALAEEPWDVYLARIVRSKLDRVLASTTPREVVLVADTIVVRDGAILGKPRDATDAAAMLGSLAGRTHQVVTRFAFGDTDGARSRILHEESVTTDVTFRALDEVTIARYVATGEGVDKAGAYAVQGRAAGFASRIDGSYANVVGLPACEVMLALEALGLLR